MQRLCQKRNFGSVTSSDSFSLFFCWFFLVAFYHHDVFSVFKIKEEDPENRAFDVSVCASEFKFLWLHIRHFPGLSYFFSFLLSFFLPLFVVKQWKKLRSMNGELNVNLSHGHSHQAIRKKKRREEVLEFTIMLIMSEEAAMRYD